MPHQQPWLAPLSSNPRTTPQQLTHHSAATLALPMHLKAPTSQTTATHLTTSLARAPTYQHCINTSPLKAPCPPGEGISVGADISLPN